MRRVIVSGGGTGIGKATATAFSRRGDAVLILGRREQVLAAAAADIKFAHSGAAVSWQAADLADPDAVERLHLPETVDVLVNNAGGASRRDDESLQGIAATLHADIDQNVLTAQLLTAAVSPRLRRPGGRVINISSIAALRGGGPPTARPRQPSSPGVMRSRPISVPRGSPSTSSPPVSSVTRSSSATP